MGMRRSRWRDQRVYFGTSPYQSHRHLLLTTEPPGRRPEPVLLVGSGPSLERDLDQLERLRPHALLVSCGSALRPLLARGLRPDFHVEKENLPLVFEALSLATAGFDLAGITLIGNLSVDPRIPPLFERCLLVQNATCTPRVVLRQDEAASAEPDAFAFAQPVAANFAMSALAALGFQEFYLFGIDCGSHDRQRWHLPGTHFELSPELTAWEQTDALQLTAPGNFGGTVCSSASLLLSSGALSRLIKRAGLRVANASDGAMIAGASPVPAAAITLSSTIDRPFDLWGLGPAGIPARRPAQPRSP